MSGVLDDIGRSLFTVWSQLRYEHLVAGVTGGITSTLILHPLDLIKVRLQVNDGHTTRPTYQGLVHTCQQVIRQNGWRGLYQGAVPNVWGAGASWGLYFFFYNAIKAYMQDGRPEPLGPGSHMLAATQSGILTLLITNPLWVTKTRLCLQYEGMSKGVRLHTSQGAKYMYKGMLDALWKISRHEGIPGLYKGLIPGLFGVSHGALQFMAYEELKKLRQRVGDESSSTKLSSLEYIVFAALSKMFAVVTTYPYQVVRSRLQDQHHTYNGVLDTILKTYRREGWKGFYKGLSANLLRVVPACCITFVVYENISHMLASQNLHSS
ncbi:mitochondrial folate transporter/carrier-like [Acanthaster planci]|uniref:Solute carrier family 25 member 32 n=1 Tax=Acanthaster planci TaxID=133434 RepID=A0A8B7ZD65_ACAPL|nr:mitochondrial folate transporter/carrier-like [Acanthaster planci]